MLRAAGVNRAGLTSPRPDKHFGVTPRDLYAGARVAVSHGAIPERELQPRGLFLFTLKDASSSDGLRGSVRW